MGGEGGGRNVSNIPIYCNMSAKYIYLFQMTRYHPGGTSYSNKVFSLNACAADQFYVTTLVCTREISPVKHITHIAFSKTYTSMKARYVKKGRPNEIKFLSS